VEVVDSGVVGDDGVDIPVGDHVPVPRRVADEVGGAQ
jgi:hypothetical protein